MDRWHACTDGVGFTWKLMAMVTTVPPRLTFSELEWRSNKQLPVHINQHGVVEKRKFEQFRASILRSRKYSRNHVGVSWKKKTREHEGDWRKYPSVPGTGLFDPRFVYMPDRWMFHGGGQLIGSPPSSFPLTAMMTCWFGPPLTHLFFPPRFISPPYSSCRI